MINPLIIIIQKLLFSGHPKDIEKRLGDMHCINFIGLDPKKPKKVLAVDVITIASQEFILQFRWDMGSPPYTFSLCILVTRRGHCQRCWWRPVFCATCFCYFPPATPRSTRHPQTIVWKPKKMKSLISGGKKLKTGNVYTFFPMNVSSPFLYLSLPPPLSHSISFLLLSSFPIVRKHRLYLKLDSI